MCFSSTCRPLESESLLECPYEIAVAELLSCLLDTCIWWPSCTKISGFVTYICNICMRTKKLIITLLLRKLSYNMVI